MHMEVRMRLDEADVAKASRLTGITDPEQLVRHALRRFVQLEAMGELARMRGTDPGFTIPPRRRPEMPPEPGDPG